MIRAYSQRLLPPYSGVVQIAESERVRALSFDGATWDIQFVPGTPSASQEIVRPKGHALDRSYYQVGYLEEKQLKVFRIPACLEEGEVRESVAEVAAFLETAQVPFPPADIFEFWLLDGADSLPLALMFSCCEESQKSGFPHSAEWTALPHSKMQVDNTDAEAARGEPPVNHRLQRLVAQRAGFAARGAWFMRGLDDGADFPCFLVREDWREKADHDVCQRYLQRKASRLLMLHGLPQAERERMEIAAKAQVFEVDDYFRLYPEVVNEQRLSAMRVEARMRRASGMKPRAKQPEKQSGVKEMSKDQRIFET